MKLNKKMAAALAAGSISLFAAAPLLVEADTEGHVNLIENNDPTGPRDPKDPTKPIEPEDPYNPPTDNPGPLSLDVVPTSFEFGNQKMYSAMHTYEAQVQGDDHVRQYLQVTDDRESGIYGWAITVKQDGDLRNDAYSLTGAELMIPAGEARNSFNTPATAIAETLTTSTVTINTSEQTIFATVAGDSLNGKGQSTSDWLPEEVSLTIPANTAKEGDYTNTLTWTLSAVAHS